ncbi:MAG TPA: hypothetical protein VLG13_01800 [Patescibacteria group bacterium]|nr:hypothetical protein [Patescibacteria group bacterium]
MNRLSQLPRRAVYLLVAALMTVVVAAPNLWGSVASAAGQVTTRSITLSSSAPSATSVSYTLTFTPVTTEQELIVDFCSNSPLIGDTCTATAGTDVPNTASVAGPATTSNVGASNHTIKVTGQTLTAATPKTITFTGITNPSNSGSAGAFYARILTYATGNASGYTPGSTPTLGTYVDYGGIALTTTNNIAITAKVFETLSFCVFQTSCTSGSGNAPNLTLGDATTGALSTTNNYINSNAQYTLATNAGSGVVVVVKGNTLCRDPTPANCTSGSADARTITPMSSTASTLASAGTAEQFGMCADKNSSAALTVATAYNDTTNNCHSLTTGTYAGTSKFGWDNTNATGSSGSTVVSASGEVPSVTGSFVFAAGITATTEAGIYTTSLNMIATATF